MTGSAAAAAAAGKVFKTDPVRLALWCGSNRAAPRRQSARRRRSSDRARDGRRWDDSRRARDGVGVLAIGALRCFSCG